MVVNGKIRKLHREEVTNQDKKQRNAIVCLEGSKKCDLSVMNWGLVWGLCTMTLALLFIGGI